MRLYTDQLLKRLFGVFTGIGFCAIGLYSLFGGGDALVELQQDRAFWFGVTAIIVGLIAVVVSVTVRYLDNIWCRPPKRW